MSKKVYILITIDTECDKDINWEIPMPISFKNIRVQKKILEPLFNKYSIIPTYLLSPEVLLNDDSVAILKSVKNASFGTHLHEEFVPPRASKIINRTSNVQINLSTEIEKLKLKNLTELFEAKMGYAPKSFRSGRFGSSTKTCEILNNLGYKVDSSVLPFKTLHFNKKKVKSWHLPLEPYFVNQSTTNRGILEVPLTLINRDYEKIPKFLLKRLENQPTSLKRIMKKIGFKSSTEWLRPYRTDGEGLISIANHVISHHFLENDFTILNIMFHSNELLEGGSPYCQSEREVHDFVNSMDMLFQYIAANYQLCSIGLEDVYTLYSQD